MRKFTLFLGILLIPFLVFSQWIQLGQDFESLNYNLHAPASYNGGGGYNPLRPYMGDEFGDAVALSADGSIMAIGAPVNNGSGYSIPRPYFGYVQVFRYVNGEWIQIGEDLRTGDRDNPWPHNLGYFGFKLDLSDDGNILAVTEPQWQSVEEDLSVRGGRVHIYENINDEWVQIGEPITDYDENFFGYSLSLSADGGIVAVGNPMLDGGRVKTYMNVAGQWIQLGSTLGEIWVNTGQFDNPQFGYEITMSADGTTMVVGMGGAGQNSTALAQAKVFEYISDDWVQTGTIPGIAGKNFALSMSLSADGSRLVISASLDYFNRGKVYIYDKIAGTWELTNTIFGTATMEIFGNNVSLSANGNVLAVSSHPLMNHPTNPIVKLYHWNETSWVQAGSFFFEPTWTDGSGRKEAAEPVVALSADGSILAVGDRTFSVPYENSTFTGTYNGAGRAYAYLDCSFVNISVTAEEVEAICEDEHTTLTAQIEQELYALNGTINWYENSDDTTPFHIGNSYETAALNQTTSFWVEGVTATGCPSERVEVTVTVLPIIAVVVGFSYGEICITDTIAQPVLDNDFTPGGQFSADSSSISIDLLTGEIDVANSHSGTYTITYEIAVDEEACMDFGSLSVDVTIAPCFIQRGISPNEDGLNDYFDLIGLQVKRLAIYNRYGREVYLQSNYIKEWKGQDKNGNELPTGTYFYAFENEEGEQTTGWIYISQEQ